MWRPLVLLCLLSSLCLGGFAQEPVPSLFVDPTQGNDENEGAREAPFRSIQKAMERAAEINQRGVDVWVSPGLHFLSEPIRLGKRHSGREGAVISLRGAPEMETRLSGGVPITGWEPSSLGEGIFQAPVPEGLSFGELYVNGEPAIRARFPNRPRLIAVGAQAEHWEKLQMHMALRPIEKGQVSLEGAELFTRFKFAGARLRVTEVGKDATREGRFLLQPRSKYGQEFHFCNPKWWGAWNGPQLSWFEGNQSMLDAEGEWWLDEQQGVVHLKPFAGVDLNAVEVIAPHLEILLLASELEFVRVQGLSFEHSHWQLNSKRDYLLLIQGMYSADLAVTQEPATRLGDNSFQRSVLVSALEFVHCKNLLFERNLVANTGAGGLAILHGGEDIEIRGNVFHTIGGNGITGNGSPNYGRRPLMRYAGVDWPSVDEEGRKRKVGRVKLEPEGELAIAKRVKIHNNVFANIGVRHFSVAGIVFFFAKDLEIAHNEMYALIYQGIHTGWNGPVNIGRLANVRILNNEISDYVYLNNDGGAIHTVNAVLGEYLVRGNYLHSPAPIKFRKSGAPLGVYLDNGTTNALVEGNYSEAFSGDLNSVSQKFPQTMTEFAEKYDLRLPVFANNHNPSQNPYPQLKQDPPTRQKLSEQEQQAIIENAGLESEFEEIRELAPASRVWEGAKGFEP